MCDCVMRPAVGTGVVGDDLGFGLQRRGRRRIFGSGLLGRAQAIRDAGFRNRQHLRHVLTLMVEGLRHIGVALGNHDGICVSLEPGSHRLEIVGLCMAKHV
jgi:hypothetical protein